MVPKPEQRPIRAWDEKGRQMLYFTPLKHYDFTESIGLCDMSGNDLYANDIIEFINSKGKKWTGVIRWDAVFWYWSVFFNETNRLGRRAKQHMNIQFAKDCKLVGNWNENPDMVVPWEEPLTNEVLERHPDDRPTVKQRIETEIIEGVLRYKKKPLQRWLGDHISLNELWALHMNGHFSDDEVKQFYRDIGYSLSGFGDVFGVYEGEEEPVEEVHESKDPPTMAEVPRIVQTCMMASHAGLTVKCPTVNEGHVCMICLGCYAQATRNSPEETTDVCGHSVYIGEDYNHLEIYDIRDNINDPIFRSLPEISKEIFELLWRGARDAGRYDTIRRLLRWNNNGQ